jgi:hypothetical protein
LKRLFFFIGFFLGIGFFVVSNIYAYHIAGAPCDDCSISFGFPFPLGRTGGFAGGTNFIIWGLFLNSAVGLVTSLVFAWLFASLLAPLVDLFRQASQWHVKTRS